MFKTGDIIQITERFDQIKKELLYEVYNQSLTLEFLRSREKDSEFSLDFRKEHKNSMTHYVVYIVTKVVKRGWCNPRARTKKMAFLQKHNNKNKSQRVGVFYFEGKQMNYDKYFQNPSYGEYASDLLRGVIGGSHALNILYELSADKTNWFNWTGAIGEMGFAPTKVLSDYFVLDSYGGWWNHVPYHDFEYEKGDYKWWFSVFDEYELAGIIDFYYPENAQQGDNIEIIIVYHFGWWLGGNRKRVIKIKWVDGAEGLTVFCLLPHIYLFAIELAMIYLRMPRKKIEAVRNYCYRRMLDNTKLFRDKNAIINF